MASESVLWSDTKAPYWERISNDTIRITPHPHMAFFNAVHVVAPVNKLLLKGGAADISIAEGQSEMELHWHYQRFKPFGQRYECACAHTATIAL